MYGKMFRYFTFRISVMKKIVLSIFLSLFFFLGLKQVYAENEAILFWSEKCQFCHTVRENIEKENIREKVSFDEIELDGSNERLELFEKKVQECGIIPQKAGIPMLYIEGKCYQGIEPIMTRLRGENPVEDVDNEDVKQEALEEKERGKANTRKMILIFTIFLILLPIFGIFIQKQKGKKLSQKEKRRKGRALKVLSLVVLPLFFASKTYAICPLCTIAVGAGVGLSRTLGIDDAIVAIWIGGLLVSSSMWLAEWFKKRKFVKKGSSWIWSLVGAVLMYAMVLIPLKVSGTIGHPFNTLLGIDKVVFGIILGSVVFYFGGKLHFYLQRNNKGKVYFPYQKVVIPMAGLLLTTIFLYFVVY